jgi:high-affinity iron transporter
MAAELRQVGRAVSSGTKPLAALAIVCGMAVLREGAEVVLFLYGIAASGTTGLSLLAGGLLGILGGAVLTVLSYAGLLIIPQHRIFAVTGVLITLLAAGMAAQAVFYLNAAGYLSVLQETAWDTSGVLPQSGMLGLILHTLIGYSDHPTQLQLVAYVATIVAMIALMRVAAPTRRSALIR